MAMKQNKKLLFDAFLNVTKQFANIVFPLITFPYITKVFGADYYGKYNYTVSIINIIALIAGLGISNYAIREGSRLKDDRIAFQKFINEILSLNCLALAISYIVLALIIGYYWNIESYRVLLVINAISLLFNVIGCEWLNVIYEEYAFITVRYIIFQFASVVCVFSFIKQPQDLYKYAMISQIACVFANVSNLVHFRRKWGLDFKLVFNRCILSHLKYVLILFGNAISVLIYVSSDVTIIGMFCNDADVGIYSVAVKIYTIVKQLLNAMMLVAIPRMARWTGRKSKEEVDGQLNRLLSGLIIYLFPAVVGLFCLSRPIVMLFSGPEYEGAITCLKILSLALLFATGVCFYSNLVLIPNDMEKYILKATSLSALLNIILNLILIPQFGFVAAAYTTLISEGFSFFYMAISARDRYLPSVIKTCAASSLIGVVIYISCTEISLREWNNMATILASVALSILIWGLYWSSIFLFHKRKHRR